MRIAHINYIPLDNVVGVAKKIKQQADAARDLNLSIDFIILNSDLEKQDKNLIYKKLKTSTSKIISKLQKRFFRYKIISNTLNLRSYDYVILRYPGMDFSSIFYLNKFVRNYGNIIITEHHTDEIKEIKSRKMTLVKKIRVLLEKKYAKKLLSNVKGIIGVTDEIRLVELNKIKKNKPSCVVSNGISTSSTPFAPVKKFDNSELVMVFVASSFSPWHGLDRLLEGLKLYSGDVCIRLYLIGDLDNEYIDTINELDKEQVSIEVLGRKYGDELNTIYNKSNLAISSLALHRNGLSEACVLKTREYIARGIPFVYGYSDSDLDGSEDFALRIQSNDSPVDISKIIKFVKQSSENNLISHSERNFALEKLDWKNKVVLFSNFINELKLDDLGNI